MVPTPHPPRLRRVVASALVGAIASVLVVSCALFGTDVGAEGVDVRWVDVDGQNGREALVVAPEGHFTGSSGSTELPLVVVLHGLGLDAEEMARLAEWPAAARDTGFVAVFGQGIEESWNAGQCCGASVELQTNDVAYLDALIAQMVAEEGVDPDRVYLTGYSNGAMMTYLYSCLAPDAIAGAASVAGTNFSDCEPGGAVDFLQVSGADDPVIPVLGGDSSLPGLPEVPPVEGSMLAVAAAAGCEQPGGFELNGIVSFQGEECSTGARVRYDVISGLGHDYPTAAMSPDYVAVDKILEFWGFTATS